MSEFHHVAQLRESREGTDPKCPSHRKLHYGQILRFSITGGLNTILDLLILNSLFWLFPTSKMVLVLLFNSLAYSVGAVNSFLLNKYWTFQQRQEVTGREVRCFVVTTLCGVCCNNTIIWCANTAFHFQNSGSIFWMNASKGIAIAGTMLISFCGMRLWVFVNKPQQVNMKNRETHLRGCATIQKTEISDQRIPVQIKESRELLGDGYSLSVILPAYNEEQIIAHMVTDILDVLQGYLKDFEVIVVNDGSTDQTAAIVSSFSSQDQRVRLVSHSINQGYGAALVSGFAAATKDLTFFMDSDGELFISTRKWKREQRMQTIKEEQHEVLLKRTR